MNTDFSKIDKTSFRTLQHEDGSCYYGQVVLCLSATEPRPEKSDGFEIPAKGKESMHGGRLIVKDLSLVSDELQAKLQMLRHGYGIQIFADKSRYAGQWFLGKQHGDGHLRLADGSEYRGNFTYEEFDGYGQFIWPKSTSDPKLAD